MKMSQAIHQLQLDQEVTTFSLSVTKNIFAKTGLSKALSSIKEDSSPSFSPIDYCFSSNSQTGIRSSSYKKLPSYSFGFPHEHQCLSPAITEESTPRSNSIGPIKKKDSLDQDKYDFSIRIVEPDESVFVENLTDMTVDCGYTEYSYASNALPTVIKVSRGEVTS